MGCTSSRTKLSQEETYLVQHENELNYHKKPSLQADLVIRKYSYKETVNASQLRNTSERLGVLIANTGNFNKVEAFYNSLKKGESIPLQTLLVLSLLLTQGSATEKARLLFETYDTLQQEELEHGSMAAIINELFEISVVRLPILVNNFSTSEAGNLKQYLAKIEHIKGAAIAKLVSSIAKGTEKVKRVAFIETLASDSMKSLLTTSGFRGYFFNEYNLSSQETKSDFERHFRASNPLPTPPVKTTAKATSNETEVSAHQGSKKTNAEPPADSAKAESSAKTEAEKSGAKPAEAGDSSKKATA